MPGTIQVTVMEFKGVSSPSKPSAKSLKVSMGKRHYQTWDKGDFSFPITKLREDLVVAILDAGGNEIAHTNIRIMQVIEKGSWDEVFPINRGGHVHMKLQFILSEEERNRIRVVRESAMRRKLETNPNINLRLPETISSAFDSSETSAKSKQIISDSQKGIAEIDVKVEASQAGSSSASSATSSAIIPYQKGNIVTAIPNAKDGIQFVPPSSPDNRGVKIESPQVHKRVQDANIETQPVAPIRLDIEEEASSKLLGSPQVNKRVRDEIIKIQPVNVRSVIKEETSSKLLGSAIFNKNSSSTTKLQNDPIRTTQNQSPLEKTPSKVRKMISALENTQPQETKPLKKSQSVQSQLNRYGKEGLMYEKEPKVVMHAEEKNLRNFKDHFARNLNQSSTTVGGRDGNNSTDTETSRTQEELASMLTPISSRGNDAIIDDTSTVASRATPISLRGNDANIEDMSTSASTVTPISSRENDANIENMSTSASTEPTVKELERSDVDVMRRSISETSTSSGRLPDEQSSQETQGYRISSELINSSESSSVAEGSGEGRGTGLKDSTMMNVEMTSNPKMNSLAYYKEECDSTQSSGMWIFPDNTRRLCITTAGKQVGHHQVKKISSEPEVLQKNLIHETEYNKNKKKIRDQPESESDSPPKDSSNGLIGQVIKIAVIVGFGVLVLLTRQKEPRKKHREDEDDISSLYQIKLMKEL